MAGPHGGRDRAPGSLAGNVPCPPSGVRNKLSHAPSQSHWILSLDPASPPFTLTRRRHYSGFVFFATHAASVLTTRAYIQSEFIFWF